MKNITNGLLLSTSIVVLLSCIIFFFFLQHNFNQIKLDKLYSAMI